uniref:Endonuclease/exonuclease/phosphatase domain-containing protein n=1 Tax=Heliothis virescens TaxID=7102 RepID=A0A2A4JUB7_HELVI
MERNKPPDPPDPPDISFAPVSPNFPLSQFADVACSIAGSEVTSLADHQYASNQNNRKRSVDDINTTDIIPTKQQRNQIGRSKYSATDKAPFIVHVSRLESQPNAATTLHPVTFGMFLVKNNIGNIVRDGVKKVGRNRVSVEFTSPQDANSFIINSILSKNCYVAAIPTFNITRMGVVTGVPSDLTEDEAKTYLTVPSGCGQVLKVRRIRRKVFRDGIADFKPTETCVITFDGQVLPNRIYCFYTSLPVSQYVYPTIQCRKCCRFGHVESICRSKPRCSKCGHDHPGDGCSISEGEAFCVLCSGNHYANSKSCPELGRQKAIKTIMAEKSLSYAEVFLQWNVRSVFHKKHDLIFLLNKYKPLACSIAETWLTPSLSFRMPHFNILRCDRSDGYGGSALLINNRVPLSTLSLPALDGEINVVAAKFEGLVEILDDLNLCILNDGCPTRRSLPGQQKSCVDLTFCSVELAASFHWQCTALTHGSDHYPIVITLLNKTYLEKISPPLLKYNLSKPDWSGFASLLEEKIGILPNLTSAFPHSSGHCHAKSCYDAFVSAITTSADSTFPLRNSAKSKIPSPPWWDPDCTSAIHERKEAEERYNGAMNNDNLLQYRRVYARSQRLLRKKKRRGWVKFCTSLSPSTPVSAVWKSINRFRRGCSPSISSPITRETAESFFDKIAPAYVPLLPEFVHSPVVAMADPLDEPFTMEELDTLSLPVKMVQCICGLLMSRSLVLRVQGEAILQSCLNAAGPPDESNKWFQKFGPQNLDLINKTIDTIVLNDSPEIEDAPATQENQDEDISNAAQEFLDPEIDIISKFHDLVENSVWKSINRFRRGCSPSISSPITRETAESFFDKIAPAYVPLLPEFVHSPVVAMADPLDEPFTMEELDTLSLPVKMVQCICGLLMSRSLVLRVQGEAILQSCLNAAGPPDESNKWFQKFGPQNLDLINKTIDTIVLNDSPEIEDAPATQENQDEDISNAAQEFLDPEIDIISNDSREVIQPYSEL